MFQIVQKDMLSENIVKLVIKANLIALKRKPGQFVIVKIDEFGERIPLTIADASLENGTITLVIQKVGTTSHKISLLQVGDMIPHIVGPLGQPTHIEKVGTVLAAGGGVGIAPLYPIAKEMKHIGNKLISILAARNKSLIIYEKEMKNISDEITIMTDDGSYGNKGLITKGIEEIVKEKKIDMIIAIGPAIMMKFIALLTKKYEIPTIVSLNTIMVDGTGMCGACRVNVGGKTKFVCVDGPEFDAHLVDFDEMLKRLNAYKTEEKKSYELFLNR